VKPSLPRLAVLLLCGAAGGLVASDDAPPQSPPAPKQLKLIDQGDYDPRLKGYKTPEGVKVEIVAEDPVVVNPVGLAFADDGTPYVLEWRPDPKGDKPAAAVETLRDSKGAGVYDRSAVVLEDEPPSGILLYDGWLYLSSRGTVRRCKQSKGEGPYDVKEVVAQGLCGGGRRPASGLTVGSDGWLYLSGGGGDNCVKGSDGGRATVLRSGAVFRCRPDGSKMETYATGFCESYGLAFDAVGNAFQADGGASDGCRLMHVPEGADFGWRRKAGEGAGAARAASGERPGVLPPMLTTGRGAPAGLLIYDGDRFPENLRGLLYSPDADRQSVHAYRVERKGATFEVVEAFEFLKSDDPRFRPCQAVVGSDGAIYVVDRRGDDGNGERGRIYRITWAGTKDQPALPPRPMDSWAEVAKLPDDDLVKALCGDDGSVRERARRELVRRGEKERPALLALLADREPPLAGRAAAVGALEGMWNADVQEAFQKLLECESADLRRLAADGLGRNAPQEDRDAHAALLAVLGDRNPAVRRAVALAIGRVGNPAAPDNLVTTWSFEDGRDVYLRDGLVRAIEELGKPGIERLVALGESGSQGELDKAVEAFTMMRTRPAADAVPRMLENPHLRPAQRAALLRSYANYLLDPPVSPEPAVEYLAAHPEEDAVVKAAGAEALAAAGAVKGDKAAGWLVGLLGDPDGGVRLAAIKAIEELKIRKAAAALAKLASDAARPEREREAAARALRAVGGQEP
jgi:putative membrane-bound dehydrogenase-like protein